MNFKYLPVILLIFIWSTYIFPQEKIIEDANRGIKKNIENLFNLGIKSSLTYRYDVDEGIVDTTAELVSETTLDRDNNRLTEINYFPSYSKTVNTFDENKNIVNIAMFYENSSQMSKVMTEYNLNGNIKEKIYYFGDNFTFRVNYKYDNKNNINRLMYYDSSDNVLNYSVLSCDKNGNIESENKYNQYDSLEIKYSYEYDAQNNCLKEITAIPNATIFNIKEFVYDKNGNLTEEYENQVNGKEIEKKIIYKYNKSNLLEEETHLKANNDVLIKIVYNYDRQGKRTGWTFKDFVEKIEYLHKINYVLF
jgi:hypothetical protein